MSRRYAENTKVEVQKSQAEIVKIVTQRGATNYVSGQMNGRAFVAFEYKGFPVRLSPPAMKPRQRNPEQEERRMWRVLVLWVKGQFEAIDSGLLEPYAVFMPYLQLKDGRTVSESAEQDGLQKTLVGALKLGPESALPAPETK